MAGGIVDTSERDWQRILHVNVWGVIHGARLFAKQMVARGQGGHILNTASAAAFAPSRDLAAYATTKAAVLMLSECMRGELAGQARYAACATVIVQDCAAAGARHVPLW